MKKTSLSPFRTVRHHGSADGLGHAQLNTVFVSRNGNDAGACTYLAPCRNFSFATGAPVFAGGVVMCLDSGNFGALHR